MNIGKYNLLLICIFFHRRGVVIVNESKTKWIYVVKTVSNYYVSVEKSCDVSSRTLQALLWSPFIEKGTKSNPRIHDRVLSL